MGTQGDMRAQSRLGAAFARLRGALGAVVLFSLVINILMLTGPLFMMQIYDRVLASRSIPTLIALAGLAAGLYAFFGLLEALRSRVLHRVGRGLDASLSQACFAAELMVPLRAGPQGERATPVRDLERLRQFVGSQGPVAIFDLPWLPLYLLVIFSFHVLLGAVAACGAAILVVLMLVNELSTRKLSRAMAERQAKRSTFAEMGRQNTESVAAMGMLPHLQQRWGRLSAEHHEAANRVADRGAMFSSLTKTFRFVMQSGILAAGAYLAIENAISPGAMIASSIIMSRALAPVELAVSHWQGFLAARQSLRRLRLLVDRPDAPQAATALPAPQHRLDVSGLGVVPPGLRVATLQGVRFALEAGDGLGVIGPSASGKSTLARALVGVWPAAQGEIRLDGATPDQWPRDVFGRFIGYLPQSVELFDGTVAENIARFDPEAASEAILAAARLAGVHEMILALPDGYDTRIGEGGAVLSAGQRQRVGLARALYGQPFLVVLDEPNSNLDADGETALTAAISAMREAGSIVVVVAHRPSALKALDKVLMIGNGRQQAFGPKDEVLRNATVQRKPEPGGLAVVSQG